MKNSESVNYGTSGSMQNVISVYETIKKRAFKNDRYSK
jgi:hypothetical protein